VDAGTFLGLSTLVIILASWISASYKTGFIGYSPQSSLRDKQPKFEVDRDHVQMFCLLLASALVLNILYVLIFTREVKAVVIFSLLNTVIMSYSLTYWVLFKEKKSDTK
jgi:hypothetical protein